jgi:hypothetical protein
MNQMETQALNCMPQLKRTRMFHNFWVSVIVGLSLSFIEYSYISNFLNFASLHFNSASMLIYLDPFIRILLKSHNVVVNVLGCS